MGKKRVKKTPDIFVIIVIIISSVLVIASLAGLALKSKDKEAVDSETIKVRDPAEIAYLQNQTALSMLRGNRLSNSTIACSESFGCVPKVEGYCKDTKTACLQISFSKCENPGTPQAKCVGNTTRNCFTCNKNCSSNHCT
jgi:hypothetical protein